MGKAVETSSEVKNKDSDKSSSRILAIEKYFEFHRGRQTESRRLWTKSTHFVTQIMMVVKE